MIKQQKAPALWRRSGLLKQTSLGGASFRKLASIIISRKRRSVPCSLAQTAAQPKASPVRGASPVLALCRKLLVAGIDQARPLHAYRGEVLCLIIRSHRRGRTTNGGRGGQGYAPISSLGASFLPAWIAQD